MLKRVRNFPSAFQSHQCQTRAPTIIGPENEISAVPVQMPLCDVQPLRTLISATIHLK